MARAKANPDRHGDGEAKVIHLVDMGDENVPAAPDWMDEATAELWRSVWKAGQGFYDPLLHSGVIERYVRVRVELERREREATGKDYTTGSTGKGAIIHPIQRLITTGRQELLRLEKELGLTPEATIRLGLKPSGMPGNPDQDPLRAGVTIHEVPDVGLDDIPAVEA